MASFQLNRHHSETCGADSSECQSKIDCFPPLKVKQADHERIEELVDCVVTCCVQIGSLKIGDASGRKYSDCDQADYKIQTGLAHAVVESLEKQKSSDAYDLIHWFGFCLIKSGYDTDDRITALLDALRNELLSREQNCPDCEAGICEKEE